MLPLDGVLVADLSRLYPGPFCTAVLRGLGARVVKVEDPRGGDPARLLPPHDPDGHGWAFGAVNRGKESVAVDTRTPEGAEFVRRLAKRADVLVESYRPGVLAKVGLAPEDLRKTNPRLVVLSLVGYAPDDPRAAEAGHDLNYQALAGLVAPPAMPRGQTADVTGALYGAIAVLGALRTRDRTGEGAHLVVSLADAAVAANTLTLERAVDPADGTNEILGDLPAYNVYRCADGAWLALGALEPKFWEAFVGAAERPDVLDDGFAVADPAARARVAAVVAERPLAEWLARCRAAGVPATPVRSAAEAAAATSRRGPAAALGATARGQAPRLGADTEAWLRELGVTEEEARTLRAKGVVP